MSVTARRKTPPVVRWLQVGAAATGIGIALAVAPGTAMADAGVEGGTSGPSAEPTVARPTGGDVDSAATGNAAASRVDDDDSAPAMGVVADAAGDGAEEGIAEEGIAEEGEEGIAEEGTADEGQVVADATVDQTGDEAADGVGNEIVEEVPTPENSQVAASVTDAITYGGLDAAGSDVNKRDVGRTTVDATHSVDTQGAEQDTGEAATSVPESATAIVDEAHDGANATATGMPTAANAATLTSEALSGPLQSGCECDGPATIFASISVALDRLLTGTANWLATLPDRPFTSFLEGALYLVRRTLFPASVGVITTPVKVPLYYTPTTTSSGEPKLGIWVAAGGSTTPQLFEFDTGSAGLYAAYASAVPDNSPWWGGNFTPQQEGIGVSFDSGLVYQGNSVSTAVSLFGSQYSCAALVNTGKVTVGQMDQIGTSTEPDAFWSPTGSSTGEPPIDGAFYGDFGMALTYQPDDVMNVISQLTYGWGVRPGFRVHADPITGEAWVQIGLTRKDLHQADGMYFAMVPDVLAPPGARVPNSGVDYYALQPFDATINILDDDGKSVINDPGTPILPDTGAGTTLHNTQWSPPPSPKRYNDDLIDWTDEPTTGKLYPGLTFFLTGITTDGTPVTFFEFGTAESTDGGRVAVQNTASSQGPAPTDQYYLNTGLSLFQMYDVVYSLGNSKGGGTLGLIPQGLQASGPRLQRSAPRVAGSGQ